MGGYRQDFRTQTQIVGGLTESGTPVPLKLNDDGTLSGGGSGPSGGATSAKQDQQIAEAETQTQAMNRWMEYQFGIAGTDTLSDTLFSGADYYAMYAVSDIEFLDLELGAGHTGDTEWVNKTIPAGTIIYIAITSAEFNGTAQFFKRPN